MNPSRLEFIRDNVSLSDIKGKRVLEVGSRNVNGSARHYIESLQPLRYTGVDIQYGYGVDYRIDVSELIKYWGTNFYDVVICTEVLEHVDDWRNALTNIDGVLKTCGLLILTVPTIGQRYHGHPNDYWRFTVNDFKAIFYNAQIELRGEHGLCVKYRKQYDMILHPHLNHYPDMGKPMKIHSILRGKPIERHTWFDYLVLKRYRIFQIQFRRFVVRILPRFIKNLIK